MVVKTDGKAILIFDASLEEPEALGAGEFEDE